MPVCILSSEMHRKLSALLSGDRLYCLALCPFNSAQPALFYQHNYSPSSPLFQISFEHVPCLLSSTLSFTGSSRKQNKKLSCFYKYFSLLKSEKTYFEICTLYVCTTHINCTTPHYIMMLSCKILRFFSYILAFFTSRVWHGNDLPDINHCDSCGFYLLGFSRENSIIFWNHIWMRPCLVLKWNYDVQWLHPEYKFILCSCSSEVRFHIIMMSKSLHYNFLCYMLYPRKVSLCTVLLSQT